MKELVTLEGLQSQEKTTMPFRMIPMLLACAACAPALVHAQATTPSRPDWIQDRLAPPPLPPISPLPHWYEVRGGTWQVPLETVQHMASLFDAKLASNENFQRAGGDRFFQFRGELLDNVRIIRLLGNCSQGSNSGASLSMAFLQIRDGGMCVFDAEYDPVQQRISYFRYYGR